MGKKEDNIQVARNSISQEDIDHMNLKHFLKSGNIYERIMKHRKVSNK